MLQVSKAETISAASETADRGAHSIQVYVHSIDSPLGILSLAVDHKGRVVRVAFGAVSEWGPGIVAETNKYACGSLALQLKEYFSGSRRSFDLELSPIGTDFQLAVWERLQKIGYGSTISYGELARRLGRRGAARAVATAVATNPIPILIPCHRVILSSGLPGKYALRWMDEDSGSRLKQILFELEGIGFKTPVSE